jgi:hypothetical protein
LSLEALLSRGGGWGSQLQEFHIKRKGPLILPFHPMRKRLPFQLAPTNFFQKIVRRLFELRFINEPFSPGLSVATPQKPLAVDSTKKRHFWP